LFWSGITNIGGKHGWWDIDHGRSLERDSMSQATHEGVRAERVTSEMFARVFQAYLECSDEVQSAIRQMVIIVNDEDATQDEREAAVVTISEALFPSKHKGDLGIDLEDCDRILTKDESKKLLQQLDAEEASFAERLRQIMDLRDMTQGDLAQAIGVGQSAISMMLSRDCRPQRRTVEKLAEILKVSIEDLWPGIKGE
jgi:DNA-binding XRE family transcriptional regulator